MDGNDLFIVDGEECSIIILIMLYCSRMRSFCMCYYYVCACAADVPEYGIYSFVLKKIIKKLL